MLVHRILRPTASFQRKLKGKNCCNSILAQFTYIYVNYDAYKILSTLYDNHTISQDDSFVCSPIASLYGLREGVRATWVDCRFDLGAVPFSDMGLVESLFPLESGLVEPGLTLGSFFAFV